MSTQVLPSSVPVESVHEASPVNVGSSTVPKKRKKNTATTSSSVNENKRVKVEKNEEASTNLNLPCNLYLEDYNESRQKTLRYEFLLDFHDALLKSRESIPDKLICSISDLLSDFKKKKNFFHQEAIAYLITDGTLEWTYKEDGKEEVHIKPPFVNCDCPSYLVERGYFEDKEKTAVKKRLNAIGLSHTRIKNTLHR